MCRKCFAWVLAQKKTLNKFGDSKAMVTERSGKGRERCFQGRPIKAWLDMGKKRTGNTKGGSEVWGLGSGVMEG